MISSNPLTTQNSTLFYRYYVFSFTALGRGYDHPLPRMPFLLRSWQVSTHPWDSCQATLTSLVWLESPFSLSSEVLIVPKLAIPSQPTVLGWHVAGAQSTFAEWMNLKWSTVGRMKKVPGDFAIGWTSTSKRLLSDHICTGTPLALSLFLFAQHFYPFLSLGSHRNFTSF